MTTFDYWVQGNGCTPFQTEQSLCTTGVPTPGLSGNNATGCMANVEVQFIWGQGIAHEWLPENNIPRWLFFSRHPKQ